MLILTDKELFELLDDCENMILHDCIVAKKYTDMRRRLRKAKNIVLKRMEKEKKNERN